MKGSHGRAFCAAWLSLCFWTVALAQDPTKVEETHYKPGF